MPLVATINLEGEELIEFLREHRIRVRSTPDAKDNDTNVLSIAEHSTDTSKSPKGFVDHVDGLARDMNHEITRLESMGVMKYQGPAVTRLREAISELIVVSSIALREVHGIRSEQHAERP